MILSIIIPYHDEGIDFLLTTIKSIRDTIDIYSYEIIVVDDFSKIELEKIEGVTIIRHTENLGVGAAFDTGVKISKSENLFLIGSDIRFDNNMWASQIVDEINNYTKSFTCTSCVSLIPENLNISERRLINVVDGATILMFHDKKSNPSKSENFKSIIEAQWLPHRKNRDIDSYSVPCILGAAYGVKKSWYEYVDGWSCHKKWGTLEPYISLKSWFFGGSCRVAPRIEIGHIFKPKGTHGTTQDVLFYNKMMVATLLFDDYERLIEYLGNNITIRNAKKMYNDNLDLILKKKNEYKEKIIINHIDFFDKWRIDYRTDDKL